MYQLGVVLVTLFLTMGLHTLIAAQPSRSLPPDLQELLNRLYKGPEVSPVQPATPEPAVKSAQESHRTPAIDQYDDAVLRYMNLTDLANQTTTDLDVTFEKRPKAFQNLKSLAGGTATEGPHIQTSENMGKSEPHTEEAETSTRPLQPPAASELQIQQLLLRLEELTHATTDIARQLRELLH